MASPRIQELLTTPSDNRHLGQLQAAFLEVTKYDSAEAIALYQALSTLEKGPLGQSESALCSELKDALVVQMQHLLTSGGPDLWGNERELVRRFSLVVGADIRSFNSAINQAINRSMPKLTG